jgi:hypothetical protein
LLLIGFSDLGGVDAGCFSLQFTSEVKESPVFPSDPIKEMGKEKTKQQARRSPHMRLGSPPTSIGTPR